MLEDRSRRIASEALEAAFDDPVPEDWLQDVTSHESMEDLRGKLPLLTDRDLKIALPHILNDILNTVFEDDGASNIERVVFYLSGQNYDAEDAWRFDDQFRHYSARQAEAIYLWLLAMNAFDRELLEIMNLDEAIEYWHSRAQAGGLD